MYETIRFTPGKSAIFSIKSRKMSTIAVGQTIFSLNPTFPFAYTRKRKRHDKSAVPLGWPCMRSDRLRL